MKFSLCIEMLYEHLPFNDRFRAASNDGFCYAEFWRWKGRNWDGLTAAVHRSGISVSAFSGDDTYSPTEPRDRKPYIEFLRQSLEKAKDIGCPNLVIHSDALDPADGSAVPCASDLTEEQKLMSLVETLREAAGEAEASGVTLVLEPLNTLVDHRGYFLSDPDVSFDLVRSIGSCSLRVLFDVYHMQIMKGNVIDRMVRNLDVIGYIHAADVPGRNEPGTGELNYYNIFQALRHAGYGGFAGFELSPSTDTASALKAIRSCML